MYGTGPWCPVCQSAMDYHHNLREARLAAGALGSPGFVAPEIVMDMPHALSMDIFSLGVVLFIMLVGRKPFNIADSESLAYVHSGARQSARPARQAVRRPATCGSK